MQRTFSMSGVEDSPNEKESLIKSAPAGLVVSYLHGEHRSQSGYVGQQMDKTGCILDTIVLQRHHYYSHRPRHKCALLPVGIVNGSGH